MPASKAVGPIGAESFIEFVAKVAEAVAEKLAATACPQMLDQPAAIAYTGLPRSTWFRLKSMGRLPSPSMCLALAIGTGRQTSTDGLTN